MRIAIDMQPCQTGSRKRGIGRYALGLANAIVELAEDIDVVFVLDGGDVSHARELRAVLRKHGNKAKATICHYPIQEHGITDSIVELEQAAALLRSKTIAALHPDVLLVTSFFEGFDDGAGVSSSLDWAALSGIKTAVVAYDLIPLLFPERYLPAGSAYESWYRRKLEQFCKFDLFLAISESTKRDLMLHLGISEEKIKVVAAGIDDALLDEAGTVAGQEILEKLGINGPFVLAVGNADWRKNNLGAIDAFARLPKRVRKRHQLVMTQIGPDVQAALSGRYKAIACQVVVLGWVDNSTLASLYRHSSVVFFPSLYEGFGLPVLEAMALGAPVLSSNRGSLPEVTFPLGLFDPLDTDGAASLLSKSLCDQSFRRQLTEGAVQHALFFTWRRCASLVIEGLKAIASSNRSSGRNEWEPDAADVDVLAAAIIMSGKDADRRVELGLQSAAMGARRRLLVDVTIVASTDARTGIQRVVRNYCVGLINIAARTGLFEVVPFQSTESGILHARGYVRSNFGIDLPGADGPLEVASNDLIFMLDSTWENPERFTEFLDAAVAAGGEIVWMVYDLVPIRVPHTCHPGMPPVFACWLEYATRRADGIICISAATQADLENFMATAVEPTSTRPWTRSLHLGSDLESGTELPHTAVTDVALGGMGKRSFLLAIGTVEPRKDHATILGALDRLWAIGEDIGLVIVGKQGWNVDDLAERIRNHPEAGSRLFWIEHATDGDLQELLRRATGLIQASILEGFGLPIVEAGSKGIPLVLSDIPVFREIAGEDAVYFRCGDPNDLANVIKDCNRGGWKKPTGIRSMTWRESSEQLASLLLPGIQA